MDPNRQAEVEHVDISKVSGQEVTELITKAVVDQGPCEVSMNRLVAEEIDGKILDGDQPCEGVKGQDRSEEKG